MTRKLKLLTGLSTLAVASAFALAGCGGEGEGAEGEGEGATTTVSAEGEGEGAAVESAGEGEGGESEGEGAAGSGDPATDDAEYLHRLGQIRGHLVAFMELYRAGETQNAMMHAKHPESELYAALEPAFQARRFVGFADELTRLVDEANAENGDVERAYAAVISAIRANQPDTDVSNVLMAVSKIARTAGDEFSLGVAEDGSVANLHEYQDAYGFLTAAREMLSEEETNDINASEAIAVAHEQIDLALEAFSGLIADQTDGSASTLYGAAARIEIVALGLR